MLNSFRNFAKSIFAKLFLGLLVISFGVWGIADVFSGGATRAVSTVGSAEVSAQDYANALSRDLTNLRNQTKQPLGLEDIRRLGRDRAVLDQLALGAALEQEAADLGVAVSDDAVAREAQKQTAFNDGFGRFSRDQYLFVLRNNGLSEADYVRGVRKDLTRIALIGAVGAGARTPRAVAEAALAWRGETRKIAYVKFPVDTTLDVGEPDEATLAAYHEKEAARFTAPEYRSFDALVLTAADVAKSIEVGDEEIQSEYDARIAEFSTPERRVIDQLIYADEAAAKDAAQRATDGDSFPKLAAEQGKTAEDIALGRVTKADLPSAAADAVFAAAAESVAGPVQTPFGWAIYSIRGVEPGAVTPLDAVRDNLRQRIALDRAKDKLADMAVAIEDQIASGAPLSEIAPKTGARAFTAKNVDETGFDDAGLSVADIPATPGFLRDIFAAEAGEDPRLIESDNGDYYAFKVTAVTPAALRPLDSVRARVVAAWSQQQREIAARAAAEAFTKDIAESGKSLRDLAAERTLTLESVGPLARGASSGELTAQTVSALFDAKPGEAAMFAGNGGAQLVAAVEEVVAFDPTTDEAAITAALKRRNEQVDADLTDALAALAIQRHPRADNPAAIEAAMNAVGGRL